MAKRSQQRHARQKKDKSGCMWGIISMFDFRHDRTPKRLLSDRRRCTNENFNGKTFFNIATKSIMLFAYAFLEVVISLICKM